MATKLSIELASFLEDIDLDAMLLDLPQSGRGEAIATFDTFKNESQVALSLIEHELDFDHQILEVGAGLCLLSLFLKSKGYSITALEPLAGGFDFFEQLKQSILNQKADIKLPLIDKGAQDISLDEGSYDLIFSNNVIEHIKELPQAMQAMKSVLKPNGKMVHGCPNYFVPYEPHFGLPVFSFIPSLTKVIWRRKIEDKIDVWQSLNFVTYSQVRKLASELDCVVHFEPRLTYKAFMRLQNDPVFQQRHHATIIGKCLRFLEATGTLKLTRFLPAWASTPMIFSLSPKDTTE